MVSPLKFILSCQNMSFTITLASRRNKDRTTLIFARKMDTNFDVFLALKVTIPLFSLLQFAQDKSLTWLS